MAPASWTPLSGRRRYFCTCESCKDFSVLIEEDEMSTDLKISIEGDEVEVAADILVKGLEERGMVVKNRHVAKLFGNQAAIHIEFQKQKDEGRIVPPHGSGP